MSRDGTLIKKSANSAQLAAGFARHCNNRHTQLPCGFRGPQYTHRIAGGTYRKKRVAGTRRSFEGPGKNGVVVIVVGHRC